MNFVSILGAGLLVGTALAVIIPEGTQMLYSQELQGTPASTVNKMWQMFTFLFFFFEELKQKYELASKGTAAEMKVDSDDHGEEGLHSVIGLALVLGFVFMLLIDQIGSAKSRGKFGSNIIHFSFSNCLSQSKHIK